jgi:hypothetical protein
MRLYEEMTPLLGLKGFGGMPGTCRENGAEQQEIKEAARRRLLADKPGRLVVEGCLW